MNRSHRTLPLRSAWLIGLSIAIESAAFALAQDRPRGASIEAADGKIWGGSVVSDSPGRFRFQAKAPGPSLDLDQAGLIRFTPDQPTDPAGSPPFRIILGHDQAISGRGPAVDDQAVRLEVGPGGRPFAADRSAVLAVRQRPGEAVVLLDGFESWDRTEWDRDGEWLLDESDHRDGAHSLMIPASAAKLTHRLAEPIASGRLTLAFRHDPRRVQGRRWYVELEFEGGDGPPQVVRVVPGWSDESPGVETPEGPSLAIQRLTPVPGWHSLAIQFQGDRLEITIDQAILAHGKGPIGNLAAIRLGSDPTGSEPAPADLSSRVDDLRLVRFLDDTRAQEGDRTVDEIRLISGDQIFGAIRSADPKSATIEVLGHSVAMPWSGLVGLGFRRGNLAIRPMTGQQARIAWSSGDERNLDAAEGVLQSVNNQAVELATPHAGTLTIPIDRVRSILPLGRSTRIVIDPTPHHLGDQFMPRFIPPQPEGGVLERTFPMDRVPESPAFLVLDVIEVAGAAANLDFAPLIKNGELRTNLSINGQPLEYLNQFINDRNEVAVRVRIPIPGGLLKAGENRVRFDQVGKKTDPGFLDDLGILTIAIEVPSAGENAGEGER